MKKLFFFTTIILISVLVSNAQTKLYKQVYYYKNPKHTLTAYKNILVITNASLKAQQAMKKIARRTDYKVTISSELFPPIKKYTDKEISQGIIDNHIDAILYYTITGSTETSNYSYGTYTMPSSSIGLGSYSTINKSNHFTTIEAAFVETKSRDVKELYCTGGVNGEAYGVSIAVFDEIFRQLKKIGIASPPNSKTDNSLISSNDEPQQENDFDNYVNSANDNLDKKNYPKALEDFNKVIELDSNNAIGYFGRARSKSALGDENGAIADCNKAIEFKPDFSMAYNNRGWSYFKLKKNIEALKDLNKAIELDNRNFIAYDSRQEVRFSVSDFAGCMEDCNMAISLNPKLGNSYLFRGRVYLKNGDKVKACENWSKAGEYGSMEAYEYIKTNCN